MSASSDESSVYLEETEHQSNGCFSIERSEDSFLPGAGEERNNNDDLPTSKSVLFRRRVVRNTSLLLGIAVIIAVALGVIFSMSKDDGDDSNLSISNNGTVSSELLGKHNRPGDCWMAVHGTVYDLTRFAPLHPGGTENITSFCGMDATPNYEMHHSFVLLQFINQDVVGIYEEALGEEGAGTASPMTEPTTSPTKDTIDQTPAKSPTLTPVGLAFPTASPRPPSQIPTKPDAQSPTDSPIDSPTQKPNESLTETPTQKPNESLTETPTQKPNESSTETPTQKPNESLTETPIESPTKTPTELPSESPSETPTASPRVISFYPTRKPTENPTPAPTRTPTRKPTENPTPSPTETPCEFTKRDVEERNDEDDCWIILYDTVYDFTDYIEDHPGGEDSIIEECGTDATRTFRDEKKHDEKLLQKKAKKYIIGCVD